MKKIHLLKIAIIFTSCLGVSQTLTSNGGEVKFTAVGKPGFLKIKGESNGKYPTGSVQFKDGKVEATFEITLNEFKTGIDLRDRHMNDKYLEVGKYPKAKLTTKSFSIKDPQSELKGEFNGSLELHGVTKDISGEYDYSGKTKIITASFNFKLSDFKINIPKYMGVTVSETVEVETTINLK